MKLKISLSCNTKAEGFFTVQSQVYWRAERHDVTTELLKSVPKPLLSSVLCKGGIALTICQSLLEIRPSITTHNFRKEDGDVICDVDGDELFINDVMEGKVAKALQTQLRSCRRKYKDKTLRVLNHVAVQCTIESFSQTKIPTSSGSADDINAKERPSRKDHENEKDPKATSSQASTSADESKSPDTQRRTESNEKPKRPKNFFEMWSQFADMANDIPKDEKVDLWKDKKYADALPLLLEEFEKPDIDPSDRGVLQLKIGFCLTYARRVREGASYISDGLEMLKRGDISSTKWEILGGAVRDVGARFGDSGHVKKAVKLIKCAASFYEQVQEITHAYNGLMECVDTLSKIKCSDWRDVVKLAEDLHRVIFKLGEDKPNATTLSVRCMSCYNMAYLYHLNRDTKKETDMYREAIDMYEEKDGSSAKFHRVYGLCLMYLGQTLQTEGKLFEAEETLARSLISLKMSNNWKSEMEREKIIRYTENMLRPLRLKLSTI